MTGYMTSEIVLVSNFKIIIPGREDWQEILKGIFKNKQIWYTYGSKLDDGSTDTGVLEKISFYSPG